MDLGRLKFWKRDEGLSGPDPLMPMQPDARYPAMQDPMASLSMDPLRTDPSFTQSGDAYPPQMGSQQYPTSTPFPGTQQQQVPQQWETQRDTSVPMQGREVDLILAKLDAIRSELDALHQRVRRIEQLTDTQTKRSW